MSNFLNQFDKNNYDNIEEKQPVVVEPDRQVAIQGPVHTTEVDRSFHRNRIIKLLIIAVAVIAVCITGVLIFRLANRVDVKPLVGGELNDAKSWALKNRIELNIVYEFDLENKKDIVIVQDPEDGKKIQRGSIMDITVSEGPDPDEIIKLPDFSTMSMAEVREWINENKTNNASVFQEYSKKVENGEFIKLEFRNELVTESNYTRKDIMFIYFSKGEESVKKNITIPNLKGKTKEEVKTWAESNKIDVTFEEAASDEVAEKLVVSQTTKPNEKVTANHEMTVIISLGKGVSVPDFNNISKDEAMMESDLMVDITSKYSASVPFGRVISQSVAANTTLYGEEKKVSVVYSLGRPFIDNLVGTSEKDLPAYFYELKSKGVNITYTTEYIDNSAPKGSVVYASRNSEFVEMSLNVYVEISRGNLVDASPGFPESPGVPDLMG